MMRGIAIVPAIVACALVASACAPAVTTSPSPTVFPATSSATATPSLVASTSAPSPSAAATRSVTRTPAPVPAPAEPVIRVDAHGDTCCGVTSIVVAGDGTYLASSADFTTDYTVRQLTPDGVRMVRDRILATRLFGADASFGLLVRPGVVPPAHGATGLAFSFWDGTKAIHVSFTRVPEGEEQLYEPSSERDSLAALATALRSPETWLPASAWKDALPRPFVAASYRVISGPAPVFGPPDPPFDLTKVGWPFTAPLTAFGDTILPAGQSTFAGPRAWSIDGPARCARVTRDDATAIREALTGARAPIWGFANDGFGVQGVVGRTTMVLLVLPTLPAAPPCAEDLF